MNINEIAQHWSKVNTKTTILGTFIDWFSDQEVILLVKNHTVKINGAFYAENYSQIRYTLHPENGEWKIYEYEIWEAQYVEPEKLFNQSIEVPIKVKSEIEAVLIAQNEALNAGDVDAYTSMNIYPDENVEQAYLSIIPDIIDDISNTTIQKWAVVNYTEPDQATVLISTVQEGDTMEGKLHKIYSQDMQKVDGEWKFLLLTRSEYSSETIK